MSVPVEARGLKKTYRDGARRVDVLTGIDLRVEPGEFVSVVGPSGSGKSTLLHLLGALDQPDEGAVEIGGTSLAALDPRELASFRNRTIGFVFQFQELLPDFDAEENVMMPGRIAGLEISALRRRARDLLAEVGLEERLDHYPNELSGGERQRVALCRALLLEPPLLLADEPTGNLDAELTLEIMDLLVSAATRGTAVFVATHDAVLIERYGKRTVKLEDGRIVEDKPGARGLP